jgi:hypothetical protein
MNIPAIKQVPSPNWSNVDIEHDIIVAHDMEGYYEPSVSYLCRPGVQASAHLCMNKDGSEFSQLVPLGKKAWAQCSFNSRGVSIEMPGFVKDGIPDVTLLGGAWATAYLCRMYDIPPVHAEGGKGRGICSHHDLGPDGGGHVDIGPVDGDVWKKFEAMVQAQYEVFGPGLLPPWALHGVPAPHGVSLPPNVPPGPSHGGDPRNEPGDEAIHDTASGFPLASIGDVEWRLRKAGANPQLKVDGIDDPITHRAIGFFQKAVGLPVTCQLSPATWTALVKMVPV